MANAKIETITKTVETEIEEEVYNLTLSKDEAQTLYALLGLVGGSASTTYNKHTYSIWNALGGSRGIVYKGFSSLFTIAYNRIDAKTLPDNTSF